MFLPGDVRDAVLVGTVVERGPSGSVLMQAARGLVVASIEPVLETVPKESVPVEAALLGLCRRCLYARRGGGGGGGGGDFSRSKR